MSAHTPGPWFTEPSKASNNIYFYATKNGRRYGIGEVWDLNGNAENLANARLIAAAPELLDALRAIQNIAADIPAIEHNPRFAEARRAALAAIAKATGGLS